MMKRDWETLLPGKNSRPLVLPEVLTKSHASKVISWLLRRPEMPKDSHKLTMTLEQAQEIGRLTKTCAVCHRHLTNKESIAFGVGPVCRARF